jgi:DNA-binding NtrC family response regulator
MSKKNLLDNKKILIVDDEPDILETLGELLSMCDITEASTFEAAMDLMEKRHFDLVVLDIMGVDGYRLLKKAIDKNMIAVMLTAHALDAENLKRSYKEGAGSYIPKEKMADMVTYLNDILEAKEKGKSFWWRWLDRMDDYFKDKFGPEWQEMHQFKMDLKKKKGGEVR